MMKKVIMVLVGTVSLLTVLFAGDGFGGIFEESPEEGGDAPAAVLLAGQTGLRLRSFLDNEGESDFTAVPRVQLEMAPATGDLEALIRLNVSTDMSLDSTDFIDELYLRYYFGFGYLETGLMKVEWGKGDAYHVLDPLNPLDQQRGVEPHLNAMKKAVPMVKLNLYAGTDGLLELVYLPLFSGHRAADSGRWALIPPGSLPNLSHDLPTGLKASTAAARYTVSLGAVDLGLQYYYGYKPEPGYRFETVFTGTSPAQQADPAYWQVNTTLLYTQAQLVGAEAAGSLGPFTFRLELGAWLTEDRERTHPEYWDPSLVALAGVDVTIPGTSMLFGVQASETWVIDYEDRGPQDVNTSAAFDNQATTTLIMPVLDLPFGRDHFNLRLAGLYLVEAEGWAAFPSFTWSPADNLDIEMAGQFFGGGKESPYKSWEDNGNISLDFKYTF